MSLSFIEAELPKLVRGRGERPIDPAILEAVAKSFASGKGLKATAKNVEEAEAVTKDLNIAARRAGQSIRVVVGDPDAKGKVEILFAVTERKTRVTKPKDDAAPTA